jgi:hypothetical protein
MSPLVERMRAATRAAPLTIEETEMTKYMLTVHGTADDPTEFDMEAMQPIFEAVEKFNQKARDAGIWVFAGGLEPIEVATTVDNTGAEPVVTDGPFAESKEWVGGFWVFDLPDLDAALKWATEASKACEGPVEIRPFQADT